MTDDWPTEAKLWFGGITVASWVIFIASFVAVEAMEREVERLRVATEAALDRDYLLPFLSRE